ncbi:MAG TPA: hypothetical protein VHR43_08210 [Gemmatimonadales bacterium]|jgi:hypothetical protein|nr:hypothetical protein [Gemmatimonadales bacterium]
MRFKPSTWHPIAIGLSVVNLIGLGLAVGASELPHAGIHAVLALAFGLWAQRLRPATAVGGDETARLDLLEADVSQLRRELNETQERLDFTERVLAQAAAARRVEP